MEPRTLSYLQGVSKMSSHDGWSRIPLLELAEYIIGSPKYKVLDVFIDNETQELVIKYEIVE